MKRYLVSTSMKMCQRLWNSYTAELNVVRTRRRRRRRLLLQQFHDTL